MRNSSAASTTNKAATWAWIIWFITALFYFYEYALRTAPSAMIPQLKQHFSLSTAGLGAIIGAYFYAYAPAQVVSGAMVDAYGGKKVLPASVLLCVLGCWLFLSDSVNTAFCGRLLIGLGSGFAYPGILYVSSNWIAKRQFTLVIGLTQAMGLLGAIGGQAVMVRVVANQGWPSVWNYAILFGIMLTIALAVIIPARPADLEKHFEQRRWHKIRKNLKLIFKDTQIWAVSCYGGLLFIPTTVFAMLWGVPFLQLQQHLSAPQATHLTTFVFLGWIIGTPIVGFIANYYLRRKVLMGVGLLLVLILFLIMAYLPLNISQANSCLFLIGLFSSVQILTYVVAKESHPNYAKGSAVGVTNFIVFSWTAILTPLLGFILHYFSVQHGGIENITDYHRAMLVVPISLLLAGLSLFFTKETHGIQVN